MKNLTRLRVLTNHLLGFALCALFWATSAAAWDYEGHRIVNQLALASLPTNFPGFVFTAGASERIAFLSGEPDRWRNVRDLPLRHYNGPNHYIDLEELSDYGLEPRALPMLRGDFIAQLAVIRKAHPEKFAEIDAAHNEDHTRELVGLLPWAITENYAKLKSCFSYLKTFQEAGGTPEEIANAQEDVIYVMGVMGHYVGDASQPLHTTIHYRGWVGDNPHGYSTDSRIHSWIDGGYFQKVGGPDFKALKERLRSANLVSFQGHTARPAEMFQAAIEFILEQHQLVEPLYQMEKEGEFSGDGELGLKGKPFLENQLLKSGQCLGDIWTPAWRQAPTDSFLKGQLARRTHNAEEAGQTGEESHHASPAPAKQPSLSAPKR